VGRIILECYLEARKSDLPVVQSKRWAVYAGESIRFGGSCQPNLMSKRRKKSVWFNGTSKHAKTETFDRLMKNTFGITRFSGKPKTVDNWMLSALKRHDKKTWTNLKRAAANYKNIVGNSPSPVGFRFLKLYRQWLKIRRGRNLFVKGFGKFDIRDAVIRLNVQYGENSYTYTPMEITASGYGFNRWTFQLITANPVLRKYYLQHRPFWSANRNRLDELTYFSGIQCVTENPNIAPETLLRVLEQRRNADYPGYGTIDSSPEPFVHLTEAPSIDTPFGVLRPVKSPQEVMQVGQAMKNCATNYTSSIKRKSALLLALFDQSGNPVALGEVHYDTETRRWVSGQRLGQENKNLEENMYEVFQTYPLAASGVWNTEGKTLIED